MKHLLLGCQSKISICFLVILMLGFLTPANAKEVTVCNVSPLNLSLAIRLGEEPKYPTIGWFNINAGNCKKWNLSGKIFYYYAESKEKLAFWLNDNKPIKWNSWFFSMCVDPKNAFKLPAKGQCKKTYGFKRVRLAKEINYTNIYEDNHKGLKLEDIPNIRRKLIGRMGYEKMLRNKQGRETPFQLGMRIEDSFEKTSGRSNHSIPNGVQIEYVYQGMPAEEEGLEADDRIVALNGYKIRNKSDLNWVLDNVSIFQTEQLSITIIRDESKIKGSIEPLFFPFNHWEYSPSGKTGTFLWTMVDGIALGFGNELLCSGGNLLAEGVRSLSNDRDFNGKQVSENITACSGSLNKELEKKKILYEDAYNAGYWASLVVPGIPLAKVLRARRAIPLAARSRHVARKALAKSF